MKRFINILAVCLVGVIVFSSCTGSKYRIVAKYVENDSVVMDTLIVTTERINSKSKDTDIYVRCEAFKDNIDSSPDNLYSLILSNLFEYTTLCTSLKPIYIDKATYIK